MHSKSDDLGDTLNDVATMLVSASLRCVDVEPSRSRPTHDIQRYAGPMRVTSYGHLLARLMPAHSLTVPVLRAWPRITEKTSPVRIIVINLLFRYFLFQGTEWVSKFADGR